LFLLLKNEPKQYVCKDSNGKTENENENTGRHLIPIGCSLLGCQLSVILEGIEGFLGEGNGALAEKYAKANEAWAEVYDKVSESLSEANAKSGYLLPKGNEKGCDCNAELCEPITNHTPKLFYKFHSNYSYMVIYSMLL
jgi:hypothetical protein